MKQHTKQDYKTDTVALQAALERLDAVRDDLGDDTNDLPDDPGLPGSEDETIAIIPAASRQYSARFDRALTLASIAHAGAVRKHTTIPYIMHPVHVARLLERHGFSEDVVLAGLLHDVLEDAKFDDAQLQHSLSATFLEFEPVEKTAAAFRAATETFIADSFGDTVLRLVKDVTELKTDIEGERPWRIRKDEQIAHISELGLDGAGLKAADALHNSLAILRDVRALGLTALKRFNCSVGQLLWSYGTIAATLRDRLEGRPLMSELDDAVFDLTEEINRLLAGTESKDQCTFCGAGHLDTGACVEHAGGGPVVMTPRGERIRSLAHWRRLAPPVGRDRQWVTGRSAKEAARAWSQLSAPEDILRAVRQLPGLGRFHASTVVPELVTPLDDFGEGRNHDLIVLGVADGRRVLVGIEAKSDEELGPRIGTYLAKAETANRARRAAGKRLSNLPERIRLLTQLVFGGRPVDLSEQRYQLLHGIGGTLIEAAARGADVAVFVVHTFRSPVADGQRIERNKNDVDRFATLLRSTAELTEGGPFLAGESRYATAGLPFFVVSCETRL